MRSIPALTLRLAGKGKKAQFNSPDLVVTILSSITVQKAIIEDLAQQELNVTQPRFDNIVRRQ
ncbi:MAG: hypothetical protein WCL50_03445 [Spirochaetota bacterium]